jgi:hypothetical protein
MTGMPKNGHLFRLPLKTSNDRPMNSRKTIALPYSVYIERLPVLIKKSPSVPAEDQPMNQNAQLYRSFRVGVS